MGDEIRQWEGVRERREGQKEKTLVKIDNLSRGDRGQRQQASADPGFDPKHEHAL